MSSTLSLGVSGFSPQNIAMDKSFPAGVVPLTSFVLNFSLGYPKRSLAFLEYSSKPHVFEETNDPYEHTWSTGLSLPFSKAYSSWSVSNNFTLSRSV